MNLSNNCIRENNFDLNSFSLGRKIIDETSPNLIIAYVKKLFDNLELNKAKDILTSFIKLNKIVNKNLSKIIYALYLLYSINILSNQEIQNLEKLILILWIKFKLILKKFYFIEVILFIGVYFC